MFVIEYVIAYVPIYSLRVIVSLLQFSSRALISCIRVCDRAGELSTLARQGSGSACRSMYGGFVRWEMGSASSTDALDSMAVQVGVH